MALAALLAPAPLAAQSTNEATSTPVPAPPPTPAPVGDEVGPPQLRDFNLNGTVTRPAQPVTTPAPAPGPVPRAIPAPTADAPVQAAPAPRLPRISAPDRDPSPGAVTVDLPPSTTAPLQPEAPLVPAPTLDTPLATDAPAPDTSAVTLAADGAGGTWWPWLGALFAVALGGGLLWRRRRPGGARYAADDSLAEALVTAPTAPLPPASTMPTPRPAPQAVQRVPQAPPPAPAPSPAPPAAPVSDGTISSRLKPELAFELHPIRAETDAAQGAALTFDLIIFNRGSAPARDVLIEVRLINSSAQVDAEVGRFFAQPAGGGERLPLIAPMGRVSVRTRVAAAGKDLAPLVIDERKLLVPVVAINARYGWNGSEVKDSSSFLVGRGEPDGGKMAPFRLDRGALSWSGLAARLHSSGLKH